MKPASSDHESDDENNFLRLTNLIRNKSYTSYAVSDKGGYGKLWKGVEIG
jgi:hypothetical protein